MNEDSPEQGAEAHIAVPLVILVTIPCSCNENGRAASVSGPGAFRHLLPEADAAGRCLRLIRTHSAQSMVRRG